MGRSLTLPLPLLLLMLAVCVAAVQSVSVKKKCASACYGKRLTLACKKGHILAVRSAIYGPAPRNRCRRVGLSKRRPVRHGCATRKVTRILRGVCDGKRKCRLAVKAYKGAMGRYCSGVSAYLKVTYTCKRDRCSKVRKQAAKILKKLSKCKKGRHGKTGKDAKKLYKKLGKLWATKRICFEWKKSYWKHSKLNRRHKKSDGHKKWKHSKLNRRHKKSDGHKKWKHSKLSRRHKKSHGPKKRYWKHKKLNRRRNNSRGNKKRNWKHNKLNRHRKDSHDGLKKHNWKRHKP